MDQYLGVAMILLSSMNQILKAAGQALTTRTNLHSVYLLPRSLRETSTLQSVKWKCLWLRSKKFSFWIKNGLQANPSQVKFLINN